MNRIEKAARAAWPRRRMPASRCCGAAAGSPALDQGHSSPRHWEPGLGDTRARELRPLSLPFICWLCHFLSTLTLFLFSVILNNVTASLESIHQSRKKPLLTLIKKMPSVPPGEELSAPPLAPPRPAARPPAISRGARG